MKDSGIRKEASEGKSGREEDCEGSDVCPRLPKISGSGQRRRWKVLREGRGRLFTRMREEEKKDLERLFGKLQDVEMCLASEVIPSRPSDTFSFSSTLLKADFFNSALIERRRQRATSTEAV